MSLKDMDFTGERCVLEKSGALIEKEHLDRYDFALDFVKGKKVLDIACGTGYGSIMLSEKAENVLGVDISSESLQYANNTFQSSNLKFKQGDAVNLDFINDETFDVVVSFETIEHIAEFTKYLTEIRRVLKKGGLFIVSTPNKLKHSPNSDTPLNHFHVIEFRLNEFDDLLKKYFFVENIYGQHLFTTALRIKNIIIKHTLRILQGDGYKKTYESYLSKRLGGLTDNNVNNCRYFIALCKKI